MDEFIHLNYMLSIINLSVVVDVGPAFFDSSTGCGVAGCKPHGNRQIGDGQVWLARGSESDYCAGQLAGKLTATGSATRDF